MGFSPIGQVVEGMSVVDSLHTGYGEGAPRGRGPSQQAFSEQGNALLKKQFPELDYIKRVVILD
jgi:peptidyl-prolyl cis-trans isomerase A (cyclophilin A)